MKISDLNEGKIDNFLASKLEKFNDKYAKALGISDDRNDAINSEIHHELSYKHHKAIMNHPKTDQKIKDAAREVAMTHYNALKKYYPDTARKLRKIDESGSSGGTSAGSIASVPGGGMGTISRTPNLFGWIDDSKPKKKKKKK
jgi:hypothetical protein